MRRFLSGACAGAVVVGFIVLLFGLPVLEEKYEFGRQMGQLDGRLEAMEAIRAEFGEVLWSSKFKSLFSIKTSVAVSLVVDGVKTISVVP